MHDIIDVKRSLRFYVFIIFFIKKTRFKDFYFSKVFFLVVKSFNPTKPAKLLRHLSDGFNMGAIGNSLDEEPQLSNVVIHLIRH